MNTINFLELLLLSIIKVVLLMHSFAYYKKCLISEGRTVLKSFFCNHHILLLIIIFSQKNAQVSNILTDLFPYVLQQHRVKAYKRLSKKRENGKQQNQPGFNVSKHFHAYVLSYSHKYYFINLAL